MSKVSVPMSHYHMKAGTLGCLPDYTAGPHDTRKDAIESLREYANRVYDQCQHRHTGRCYIGPVKEGMILFLSGHGVDYAEISQCDESVCTAEVSQSVESNRIQEGAA